MTDTFREEYKELSDEIKGAILMFKRMAQHLEDQFNLAEKSLIIDKRCMALAKTNLEQSIMWAVKSVT